VEVVSGPWDPDRVTAWLERARIPVRLAVLAPRGPLVVSLWYRFDGEALWCATRDTADVVAHVRADPRVGIEVAGDLPPYRGVRGTGRVEVVPEAGVATLEALLERYLDARNAELAAGLRAAAARGEVALRIAALKLTSWDFSGRMRPQDGDPVLPSH
jgi:nitroimidazol reductase NimA-like FMN-containing flavoprotein (pyridoxamine 5'-phosphate oxidase superfamily)